MSSHDALRDLAQQTPNINDGGWEKLADRAAAAGYDRRKVLRYRGSDTFTATNIAAAYQQGWRDAVDAALDRLSEVRQRLDLATEYTVCAIPEDDINHGAYAITVAYRGRGRWAVTRHRWCLGTDGEWDFECRPSEREDEWLAAHRFDLDTALRLAHEAAPGIEVNGITAADVVARVAARADAVSRAFGLAVLNPADRDGPHDPSCAGCHGAETSTTCPLSVKQRQAARGVTKGE